MVEVELKFQLPESKKKTVQQYLKNIKHSIFIYRPSITIRQTAYLQKMVWPYAYVKKMICGYKPLRLPAKVIYIVSKKKFLGKCDQEPDLNLELYKDNKAVTDLITQALGSEVEKLSLQFETDVQRTYHVFEADDTAIEVCLDDGAVKTATAQSKICEVEFELKQGAVKTLIQFAQQWINRYELWLDVRSKAERGNLLALGQAASPAVHAKTELR